jgi:hypothetical protein
VHQIIRFYGDANASIKAELLNNCGEQESQTELIGSVELTVGERQIQLVGRPAGCGTVRVQRWKIHQISDLVVENNRITICAMPNETLEPFRT